MGIRFLGSAECALEAMAEASQSLAVNRVTDLGAPLAVVEQSHPVEGLQVLRDRGLSQRERLHDLAAAGFFPRLKEADYSNARRVGECSGKCSQRDLFFGKE